MKSKGIVELWDEFLALGWNGWNSKDTWNTLLVDSELFPAVFLRRYEGNWVLHLLPIATKLIIPAPWPILWSEFNTWGGGRVVELLKEKPENTEFSQLETFCLGFFQVVWHIEMGVCGTSKFGKIYEEQLGSLFSIGTEPFRKWFSGEKLKPWILETIEDRKEI